MGRVAALSALLASLLWGTADFLGGTATRRLPVTSVLGVSQLSALLGLLPLALVLGAFGEDRAYVVPALLAGLCGTAALAAFYRALAIGTMGVVAPIAALGVVVAVAVGLLGGERPGVLRLLGIAVAVVGVVLASGPELQCRAGATPLLLAALSALGFGAVYAFIDRATESGSLDSVVMTLICMRVVSVLVLGAVLVLLAGRAGGGGLGLRRSDLPVLVAIGALDVTANGAFALASQSDLVSVASVLASLYPVVTVLLARRFHAERLAGVQLAGVVLALAGVVALAAG